MKQKLPIKGLELYLNISNLTEAVDIRRLRGYNPFDPNFDSTIESEILDPSLFSYYDPTADIDGDGVAEGGRVSLSPNITDLLERVPRDQRAKSSEEHYGMTIDLGFRFSF